MSAPEFDPEGLIEALSAHGVKFVLVGGFAAVIQGSPFVTMDVDITPLETPANLEALSRCLSDINARVFADEVPEGLPLAQDARSLPENRIWNLVTDHGRVDVVFDPAGTGGYSDLIKGAFHLVIGGTAIDVASLADIVRSKEAADREKDRLTLPTLRALLDRSR